MSSPRSQRVLKDLKMKDENHICFECGVHNPQWVSVTYGVWICLECSGKHRALGVHLSFVRSVTMDKWKDLELEKMKVGGNLKARNFFEAEQDNSVKFDLQQKYRTKCAALYRDKIAKEAQGKPWSPETSEARNYVPYEYPSVTKDLATSRISSSKSFPRLEFVEHSGQIHHSSSYSNEGTSMEEAFRISKSQQPNKGDRYIGFGNTTDQHQSEDYWSNISSGWSSFTSSASKLALSASEKATDIVVHTAKKTKEIGSNVNEKVKDGTLLNNMSSGISNLSTKVSSFGVKGWKDLSTMWSENVKLESVDKNISRGSYGSTDFNKGKEQDLLNEDSPVGTNHTADGWDIWNNENSDNIDKNNDDHWNQDQWDTLSPGSFNTSGTKTCVQPDLTLNIDESDDDLKHNLIDFENRQKGQTECNIDDKDVSVKAEEDVWEKLELESCLTKK